MKKKRLYPVVALIGAVLLVTVFAVSAAARPQTVASSAVTSCTTSNVLSGSNFEIDVDANLKVDNASPCIDWLAGGTGSAFRSGVVAKNDVPSGASDDAFGQGTSEDNANPTIVTGSIPPNKSDLKAFGVFTETGSAGDKFLELFWSRVQNPSGTTNMDFELNQLFCDPTATTTNCADNGKGVTPETPLRTAGDKLVTYDLAKGGTVPTISIRTWTGSAWGPATVISGGANASALGAVNTSTIPSAETGGATGGLTTALGSQDPFTFGEAAISFAALFPSGTCGSFGSAYLKSRSSTSFTSEVKDFIAPERVQIGSCSPTITTSLSSGSIAFGGSVTDSATLHGASNDAGGTVTYSVFDNSTCTGAPFASGGTTLVTNGVVPDSAPVTFNSAGTFYWQASYSGDSKNDPAKSACTSEPLSVARAPASISTTLSASVIGAGSTVHDSATLSDTSSNAGGTVTYTVYTNNTCTTKPSTGSTGQINAQPAPVPVSNGTVPDSGPVTFQKGGTYFWQAVYSGDSNNSGASSTCTSEQLTVIGPCVLGYPFASSNPRTSVTFNESTVLRTSALSGDGTQVRLWYNDEHALLLGVRSVNGTPYPVTAMTTDPDSATDPKTGAKISDGAHDPSGRPFYPALYATDITSDPNSRLGDWQTTGGDGTSPNNVFGSWKSATETNGATTVDADPAKNNWNIDGGDTPPQGFAALNNEGYGAEVRWNVSSLGLLSKHAYRLEFMVHDGDQNKSGGDAGEACLNVFIP